MRVRVSNNMALDSEDPQLADEYVQEFVLDHFEDVSVKREAMNNNDGETVNNNISTNQRLPSIQSMPMVNGGPIHHIQSPPHHLLTPPGSGSQHSEFQNSMVHGGVLMRGVMYSGNVPGTPPDTPPGSNSPPHPHYHHLDHPHIQQLPSRAQNYPDEMIWIPPNTLRGQEPLDLRPHCAEGWSVIQHHGGKYLHDEPRPMSVSSGSVMSPLSKTYSTYQDDLISDDLLICLSVRDLNKRLHGYPRDQIAKLKAKRRTLKNRGYAQNCRSKRVHQRQELELTNKHLQQELHRIKTEYNKILEERNHYKKRYEIIVRNKECGVPPGEPEQLYL